MEQPIETWEHKGVKVAIYPDESGSGNPRDCDGNVCELFCSYRGYELGDTQLPSSGLPEIDCPPCEGEGWLKKDGSECERCGGLGQVEPTIQEWLKSEDAIAVAPLFVHEHSGITMRTGKVVMLADGELERADTESRNRFTGDAEGWDTSFVGFAVVRDSNIAEGCGDDPKYREPEWIADAVRTEVEEYAKYLEGQVYGYVVGSGTPFEDSCWGFLGWDHVQREANEIAEGVAEQIANEAKEKAEWAARDVATCGG
jgi:hypothetical protein